MSNDELDPATRRWREMFTDHMASEFNHVHEKLDNIQKLLEVQNGRQRETESALALKAGADQCNENTLKIARLKMWTVLAGGGIGVVSLVALVVQALAMWR